MAFLGVLWRVQMDFTGKRVVKNEVDCILQPQFEAYSDVAYYLL
jgi:hypothetical protein